MYEQSKSGNITGINIDGIIAKGIFLSSDYLKKKIIKSFNSVKKVSSSFFSCINQANIQAGSLKKLKKKRGLFKCDMSKHKSL